MRINESNQWSILMFPILYCWFAAFQVPNGIWETLLHSPTDVIIRLHKWLLCTHCQSKGQMWFMSQSIFSQVEFQPVSVIMVWRPKATQMSENWQRWLPGVNYTAFFSAGCAWSEPGQVHEYIHNWTYHQRPKEEKKSSVFFCRPLLFSIPGVCFILR